MQCSRHQSPCSRYNNYDVGHDAVGGPSQNVAVAQLAYEQCRDYIRVVQPGDRDRSLDARR